MNHIQLLTVRERRMLKRIEMLKNIEHPPDQKEDLAQERYLTEWNRKHGKRTGEHEQETEKEVIQEKVSLLPKWWPGRIFVSGFYWCWNDQKEMGETG